MLHRPCLTFQQQLLTLLSDCAVLPHPHLRQFPALDFASVILPDLPVHATYLGQTLAWHAVLDSIQDLSPGR